MTEEDREMLVEAAAGAHRPRGPHGVIRPHKAWLDLDAAGRTEAFEVAQTLRAMEAAMDPEGLSSTGRTVLARIRR